MADQTYTTAAAVREQRAADLIARQLTVTATAARARDLSYAARRIVCEEYDDGSFDLTQISPARPYDTHKNAEGVTSVTLWEADFLATLHPNAEETADASD